jgi:hypothetical protein
MQIASRWQLFLEESSHSPSSMWQASPKLAWKKLGEQRHSAVAKVVSQKVFAS